MERLKSKNSLLIISLILVIVALSAYIWEKRFHRRFYPPRQIFQESVAQPTKIPLLNCAENDNECEKQNVNIQINNLEGFAVDFAKHQCDGPRDCPEPDEETNKEAIEAIKIFAESPEIELIRVTGINSAGIIYYCVENGRCWNYDTNSNKVTTLDAKESTL